MGNVNVSQVRLSPVAITQLHPISIISQQKKTHGYFNKDDAFVHLEGDSTPLPYNSKFYNAVMVSVFNFNIEKFGFYRNILDRQELYEKLVQKLLKMVLLKKLKKIILN